MIKFSIITVCLNAGNDLIETVNNTLAQTYQNYEIIIKDGFSKDGSIEKLPNDRRIRLIQKKDTGIYDAMNQGIDESSGEYLIFMNAGDQFYNDQVLEELAELIRQKTAVLYYGRCYNETMKAFSNAPLELTLFFCYRSMICHQAMVFERKFIAHRKYDCNYIVSADKELLLYIVVEQKCQSVYLPIVIAKYKGSGFCETEKNKQRIAVENRKLQEQYYTEFERIKYRLLVAAMLPKLRAAIVRNPKMVRSYKKIVQKIYGTKR